MGCSRELGFEKRGIVSLKRKFIKKTTRQSGRRTPLQHSLYNARRHNKALEEGKPTPAQSRRSLREHKSSGNRSAASQKLYRDSVRPLLKDGLKPAVVNDMVAEVSSGLFEMRQKLDLKGFSLTDLPAPQRAMHWKRMTSTKLRGEVHPYTDFTFLWGLDSWLDADTATQFLLVFCLTAFFLEEPCMLLFQTKWGLLYGEAMTWSSWSPDRFVGAYHAMRKDGKKLGAAYGRYRKHFLDSCRQVRKGAHQHMRVFVKLLGAVRQAKVRPKLLAFRRSGGHIGTLLTDVGLPPASRSTSLVRLVMARMLSALWSFELPDDIMYDVCWGARVELRSAFSGQVVSDELRLRRLHTAIASRLDPRLLRGLPAWTPTCTEGHCCDRRRRRNGGNLKRKAGAASRAPRRKGFYKHVRQLSVKQYR